MSKISKEASEALLGMKNWRSGNTRVQRFKTGLVVMSLHGNEIAQYDGQTLQVSWAGWATKTTCARLNALPNVAARVVAGEVLINDYTVAPDEWLIV